MSPSRDRYRPGLRRRACPLSSQWFRVERTVQRIYSHRLQCFYGQGPRLATLAGHTRALARRLVPFKKLLKRVRLRRIRWIAARFEPGERYTTDAIRDLR